MIYEKKINLTIIKKNNCYLLIRKKNIIYHNETTIFLIFILKCVIK